MIMDGNWSCLPHEILIQILDRLRSCDYYFRIIAVCKSWRNSVQMYNPPCLLPPRYPFLLLAEEVAPGAIDSDGEYDSNEDYGDTTDEDEEEDDDDDVDDGDEHYDDEDEHIEHNDDDENEHSEHDDDNEEEHSEHNDYDEQEHSEHNEDDEDEQDNEGDAEYIYDHNKNSVGSTRGLYSLLTGKTYNIDLPEAAGRLVVGTNIGWLVTLGRDLQVNLLHPLLRYQIPLPSMLTFPKQLDYGLDPYTPEDYIGIFIRKVCVSSKILNTNTPACLYQNHTTPSPVVMAMYRGSVLGYARLKKDTVWTDVNFSLPSSSFHDIVYHKGNFYAVDCHGAIFVCGVDDNYNDGGHLRGTEIAKIKTDDCDQKYLVESSSGSGLLVLVRYCKVKYFNRALRRRPKYRTTDFSVWRLDLKSSDSIENITCNLVEEYNLGNEAIFIGRNSSTSVSSSDFIKPNSIYFTDDNLECYVKEGGGHDMGIFDINSGIIEPHYPGKSIHPISPPLWYI